MLRGEAHPPRGRAAARPAARRRELDGLQQGTPHGPARADTAPAHLRALALFFTGFLIAWTLAVLAVWVLDLLPIAAWPWFRTTFWLGAVGAWIAWRRPPQPLVWLGAWPVTPRKALSAAIAFALLLGWNLLLAATRAPSPDEAAAPLLAQAPSALLWSFMGVFVEELVFRGVIQTQLAERMSVLAAVLVGAALFLFIHVPGWLLLAMPVTAPLAVSIFLLGVICGGLRARTDSLWPAVAAHFANNLGALL